MLDALIVGGGPAGLTAATYLCRFHRRPVLIDGGASRARWIPESHNIPGFPGGIGGSELLSRLNAQASRYGTDIRAGEVDSVSRVDGGFRVRVGMDIFLSRFVLLATGILDHLPELAGVEQAELRALLRVCPICDAFEATGKRIAVISSGDQGDREAEFLRTYSDRITLIRIAGYRNPEADNRLRQVGIETIESELSSLEIESDRLVLRTSEDTRHFFDVFYAALGCTPVNYLATSLGADVAENKALKVNEHQQTSVPGLYAAGDIVRGLNQVAVAAAEAAIAATDIHNKLRELTTALP